MRSEEGGLAGCVVTGAAGFVGSHLVERLLSLGCLVVGVDNFFSGHRENMDAFAEHPAFRFYERSISEKGLLRELKGWHPGLTVCFHLAAIVSVPYSVDHPEETLHMNHKCTHQLLAEAEELGFDGFVFAGSAAEYGEDERLPLFEEYATSQTHHLSPYGRAKYLASRQVGKSPIGAALRFFNIYGPRQDPSSQYSGVISRFADMALVGKPLTIFGDGLQSRDFIYVADVVEAYIRAGGLQNSGSGRVPARGVYNIATGTGTTILELARVIQDLSCALTGHASSLSFQPQRQGDIRHSVAAPHAFQKAVGWTPAVSLRKGLTLTLRWAFDNTLGSVCRHEEFNLF